MKKISKNIMWLFCAILMMTATTFSSCSDDDDVKIDVRTQAVGTYNGVMTMYLSDYGELSQIGKPESLGEMKLEKSGSSDLLLDGDCKFTNIREASNGFGFDVPSQNAEGYHFSGFDGIKLGDDMAYNGMYESSKKEITFYYQIPIDDFSDELIAFLDEDDLEDLLDILEILDEDDLDNLDAAISARYKIVCRIVLNKK